MNRQQHVLHQIFDIGVTEERAQRTRKADAMRQNLGFDVELLLAFNDAFTYRHQATFPQHDSLLAQEAVAGATEF